MSEKFHVDNIHCAGCARRITAAIVAVQPGAKVGVDVAAGIVEVEPAPDRAAIIAAITAAGYPLHAAD